MIFFDEYRSSDRKGNNISLLQAVGLVAKKTLDFADFEKQHLFYGYLQRQSNPASSKTERQVRDGLILSRKPLIPERNIDEVMGNSRFELANLGDIDSPVTELTDNRPFFIQNVSGFSISV
ncbi:MAG: hypothetical protein HC883_04395 [Bdellovibrionaceae bacterium]|nr:hypothetical protein [Pseudobdellovibrionaceae bacterium]